jgi:hypothetical protein
MRTLTERGRYFHAHSLQVAFSLIASVVGRAGCTGARLVGKVKDHCVLEEWLEIAARMKRCPLHCSVRGRLCLRRRGLMHRSSSDSNGRLHSCTGCKRSLSF